MHKLFALSLGFAGLILATQAGWTQSPQPCGARDEVLATLTGKYGEVRRGIGLAGSGAVVELHSSPATGTWTMTVTLPSGVTCLIASGQGWEALTVEVPAKGEPV